MMRFASPLAIKIDRIERGLPLPKRGLDSVSLFLQGVGATGFVSTDVLHRSYQIWARATGKPSLTKAVFGRKLTIAGLKPTIQGHGRKRGRVLLSKNWRKQAAPPVSLREISAIVHSVNLLQSSTPNPVERNSSK